MPRHARPWLYMILMFSLAGPITAGMLREVDLTRESADIRIIGALERGHLQVATTGDLNGDGFPDLILVARDTDTVNSLNCCITQILYGPLDTGVIDLRESQPGFTISSGLAVAAGDLNSDGVDDLIFNSGGQVQIVFGSPALAGHLDLRETQPSLTVLSESSRALVVGDYNGDGIQDLAMSSFSRSAADRVFVLFGSPALSGDLDTTSGSPGFVIRDANNKLGASMATGDVNDDGIDDLLVGTFSDSVVAVFGSADLAGVLDLRTQEPDLRIIGDVYGFGVGFTAGDFDADGIDDIAIASPFSFVAGRRYAGAIEIVHGGSELKGVRDLTKQPAELKVVGAGEQHSLGSHPSILQNLMSSGDLNGDGVDDLLTASVGARSADEELILAGESYVIMGKPGLTGIRDLAIDPAEIIVHGSGWRDYLGWDTAAGDVDGDGVDDAIFVAIGGDGIDDTRIQAGEAYIILGRTLNTPSAAELVEAIQVLPDDAFMGPGKGRRQAMLSQARSIAAMLDAGHTSGALRLLERMEHHLAPCGGEFQGPDMWIQSCEARVQLRCIVIPMRKALEAPLN